MDDTCAETALSHAYRLKAWVAMQSPQKTVVLGNLSSPRASSWALKGFKDGCEHNAIVVCVQV